MEHINPTLNPMPKPMPKPTYTILDTTDYRALCAELLAALENAIRVIYHEDGTQHISTADAVITRADAALNKPEVGNLEQQTRAFLRLTGYTDADSWDIGHLAYGLSNVTNLIAGYSVALPQAEGMLSYGKGPETREWLPISTAPEVLEPYQMFVVIAMDVTIGNTKHFTTDPCCVWRKRSGEFVRWPWTFAPTHWMPLPDYNPETK